MNAIIIDDDPEAIRQLANLLDKNCRQVQLVGSALSALNGATLILAEKPDLVFLDIQMQGESGFEMLSSLGNYNFQVIFVTGYEEYAIQAIRCSALDYLIKPIFVQELTHAVSRAEKKLNHDSLHSRIDNLADFIKHPGSYFRKIALPISKGHRLVKPDEIVYLKANKNYCSFFMNDGEEILISKGLYQFEPMLIPFGIIRCHNSYLVNTHHVRQYQKESTGNSLLLFDGKDLPVGSQYLSSTRKALGLLSRLNQNDTIHESK